MDDDNIVDVELSGFLRIYKSGRVERLVGTDVVPPSVDSATGVASKDVVIDKGTGVSARLFLPDLSKLPQGRLPVLVYYHGGGFCVQSPFTAAWTRYLNCIVSQANVLAVSVDYRLAPEHPVPAAYSDSFMALQWVVSHATGGSGGGEDPWLTEHGDFSRLFLGGDSAGGTIAHHVALQAGLNPSAIDVRIRGMALIHPHFTDDEPFEDEVIGAHMETMWNVVCPATTGMKNDPLINPLAPGAPSLRGVASERALVAVAEKDVLMGRQGMKYYEGLKASGWPGKTELYVTEGEPHGFHRIDPTTAKAKDLMQRFAAFLNDR